MASSNSRYLFFFCVLFLGFLTLDGEEMASISMMGDDFGSKFVVLGDAKMEEEGNFVGLRSGQVVCKKPIRFLDGKSLDPTSFSLDFTFTMAGDGGEGLAVVFFPTVGDLKEIFGSGSFGIVKNGRRMDGRFVAVEYGGGNRVGIGMGSSKPEVVDVSSMGLVINRGERLRSWIDYEASSKRLEIRLSKAGVERPDTPLFSFPINFSELWGAREVSVGVSSSIGNSTQITRIYSWSLRVRTAPSWLHSQPLDPRVRSDQEEVVHRKKNCVLSILGKVIFVTGCGTLVAFFLLLLWVVFFLRHSTVPPEFPMKSLDFEYEKIDVNEDAAPEDVPTS